MNTRNFLMAFAALAAAMLIGGAIAFAAFNAGTSRTAGTAAERGPTAARSATTSAPRPTVTVTKHKTEYKTVRPTIRATPPRHGGVYSEDELFLDLIAQSGITAPDDWAIEAGRATCGKSYSYAHKYLTDGGLYSHHVQIFLDEWIAAHQGC
ncbi:DUF732 domain-containing protein [Actinomadura rudentiformis]|uniref:DUF732 domain-containing protein n=1 Tax=Actinomadura rudentiformis TaxID=359158 RepID=A0A6H9YEF4_9ACTN|nr:DUF732 domain-containing protein [Actinomadura rudentiformis]KAB2343721.1 hypothetical protein F8566_33920 [Actinomadura rudentiformis]